MDSLLTSGQGYKKAGAAVTADVQIIDPLQTPAWPELVASHPGSGVFHSAEWVRVMSETYGHRPCYAVARRGDRLLGLLAAVEVSSRILGRRGVSLAFSDECPPLTSPGIEVAALLEPLLRHGAARHWKFLELRGADGMPGDAKPSLCYYGHRLNLRVGEERLFSNFKSEARTAVRKAERSGLRTELSQEEESMREFYLLHCRTRKRHGVPPQSYKFFQNIQRHLLTKGMGFVAVARHWDVSVAAAVVLHGEKTAVYKFAASDPAMQGVRGNNQVLWEAIKWYARHGYAWFDFGRTPETDEGLRRFKRSFGSEERGIRYFKYDFAQAQFTADIERGKGWYNTLFRLLPLPISRLCGNLLYQHLA